MILSIKILVVYAIKIVNDSGLLSIDNLKI